MQNAGPIVIIEDDPDDQETLQEIITELNIPNKLIFFTTCIDGLNFLKNTTEQPFLIISDLNLPIMTGIEMRKKINENNYLRRKSIPFVFLTTSTSSQAIEQAYEMMVQGYFEKPSSMKDLKNLIQMIYQYWTICKHPNS